MAFTNKGEKWELSNSKYLILSVIPFFNSLCYFHMDGKVENPKWKRMGYIVLVCNLVLLLSGLALIPLGSVRQMEYSTARPKLEDFLGWDFRDKYPSSSEYMKVPEYYEYQKAYDAWKNSDEVKEVDRRNSTYQSTIQMLISFEFILWPIVNGVFFFLIVSQRATFLKALAKKEDQGEVLERLKGAVPVEAKERLGGAVPVETKERLSGATLVEAKERLSGTAVMDARSTQGADSQGSDGLSEDTTQNEIDINHATEQQLADLPGLSIVDAKNAIRYREEHGGFQSTDEFFSVIQAKPHIVVRLGKRIYVGTKKEGAKPNMESRRKIDI